MIKKLICFFIALILVLTNVPVAFAEEVNLASGCSYTISHFAKYPDSGGELTDGEFGIVNFYDQRWVGISGVKEGFADVTLDLGEVTEFDNIVITLLDSRNYGGIFYPSEDFIITYSDTIDGEYKPFTNGGVPQTTEGNSVYKLNLVGGAVKGRFIKIAFKAASWVFLTEIEVYNLTDTPRQLALCKKYYSIPSTQLTDQPDTGESRLTDGIRGDESDNTDPNWVKIQANYMNVENHAGSKTVIQGYAIDLGSEMYVSDVKIKFISKGFGGTTEHPWTVWTYASSENGDTLPEEWFMLSRQWNVQKAWHGGTHTYGWRSGWIGAAKLNKVDTIPSYTTVKTRYIRVDIEILRNAAIDEIVVTGYTHPQSNAYTVTSGRNLDTARDYQTPDEVGVKDMALCYNGYYGGTRGVWTPEKLRPYLTYVNKEGRVVDRMYDTICFLGLSDPDGGVYNCDVAKKSSPQDAKNWYWYLDKTFDIDMVALGEAAEIASRELGDPNYKVKVVVMHPGADGMNGTSFGPLDGKYYDVTFDNKNGYDYHIYPTEKKGWQLASDWWFNEVIKRFESGKESGLYDRIELTGFYYLSEQVGYKPAAPKYHIDRAHELGYKIFFIPFNYANGYHWDDDMGFDATAIQPNHFFGDPYADGDTTELGNDYLDTVAYSANYAHTGLEMEFDDRVFTNPSYYNLFLDYANGAYENGMDGDNCYRAWYQAVDAIYNCSVAKNLFHRSVYDYSYQLMKGTYTPKEYIETFDETVGYSVSGSAVKGAMVELLKDGGVVAFASSNGKYYFTDIDPGMYSVRVSKPKYVTREYPVFDVKDDTICDTDIWFYGDVTGDGVINSIDILQINRKIANLSSVFDIAADSDYIFEVANITYIKTGDLVINSSDVLQINRKIANFSSVFDSIR